MGNEACQHSGRHVRASQVPSVSTTMTATRSFPSWRTEGVDLRKSRSPGRISLILLPSADDEKVHPGVNHLVSPRRVVLNEDELGSVPGSRDEILLFAHRTFDSPVFPGGDVGGEGVSLGAVADGGSERPFDGIPEDEDDGEEKQQDTNRYFNPFPYTPCYLTQGHMNLDLLG